ncbi:MAG: hypothetical protein OJF58_000992 [Enhydrobacter sp.]|jgi:hypothetical protein|nr:MAG: hypothetical protein OJF58_000992 [Enhydrobacter sp.]
MQAEGAVSLSDLEAFLHALASKNALAYPKLFDAQRGFTGMSESDVPVYAGMVSGFATLSRFGPCAVIATRDSITSHRPLIMQLMLGKRPLGIFSDMGDAERWIWQARRAKQSH